MRVRVPAAAMACSPLWPFELLRGRPAFFRGLAFRMDRAAGLETCNWPLFIIMVVMDIYDN